MHTECAFAITPVNQLNISRLVLNIQTNKDSTTGQMTDLREHITSAVIVFTIKQQLVNSSACHISSLEVYRGINQAFQISHYGFSLGSNSTIEVSNQQISFFLMLIIM